MTDEADDETVTPSLRSITRGASLSIAGRILSNGLGFVINLLLTRGLDAGLYGIFAYGNTLMSIVSIFARLGSGKSILRFLPEYEETPALRNGVLGLAYLTALIASVVMGAVLYFVAPLVTEYTLDNPLLTDVLRILAIVLPFNTLSNLTNSVFRGLERLEYQIFLSSIVSPITRILFIGAALLLGYSLLGVVTAIAIGGVVVFGVALLVLFARTDLRPGLDQSYGQSREFYNFSLPLTLKDLGSFLYNRVDILMVGFFLAESSVGIYKIAIVISTMLVIPLGAFNQLFPPVASRLYSNDEMSELESVYSIVTRWTFTVALLPALGAILYRTEVLAIFGPEFTAGGWVLVLFALAQLTNCAVGPSGFMLMMTDHQYINLANQWTLGVLNAILNYVFILEFGLIGAAVATASVLAGINLLRVVEVWYTERLFPYSWKFWKPVGAAAGAGIVMAICQLFAAGFALLIIGGGSGALAFVGILYILGIEEDDREFFEGAIADMK